MNNTQYHPFAKFLHWVIVIIIAIQFAGSALLPEGRAVATPDFFLNFHMSFGFLILPFVVALFLMRFLKPVAKSEEETTGLIGFAVKGVHYSLYVLAFALPFTGWVSASSRGLTVNFFGLFDFPAIVAKGSSLGHVLGGMHSLFAGAITLFILGHTGAALWHHVILKDNVLNRMSPFNTIPN